MSAATDELKEIRDGLRKLSVSAMDLRSQLAPKKREEIDLLKDALRSILGNVDIAIKEGRVDEDLLPWIEQRIKGVLPE